MTGHRGPCIRCGECERDARGACKACIRARNARQYVANRDSVLARNAKWRRDNAEQMRAIRTAWKRDNPEAVRAYNAQWARDNPEKRNESAIRAYWRDPEKAKRRAAKRYRENPEAMREKDAKYRLENPEKIRATRARYIKANLDKIAARNERRRARKMAAPGDGVTPTQWREMLAASMGICAYCNERGSLGMDHIDPLNRGGAHDMENATVVCRSCNSSKNDMPMLLWLARRARARAA